MNFGLTTFIVQEINVIPSHDHLSFAAQGLQSVSDRLEFLMTSIPSCSRTCDNFSPLILFEVLNKFLIESGFQEMPYWLVAHADWLKFDRWRARFLFSSCRRQPWFRKMSAGFPSYVNNVWVLWGWKPVRRLVLCSWARYCSLSLPLFTQVWKWRLYWLYWRQPCTGLASNPEG